MRLLVPLLAARRLAVLVLPVVALTASLAGTGVLGSSLALASTETAATLHASEASNCAGRATGPASDEFKLAVCTDLDSDLVGIAKLLGLPALAPTATSLTSPVEVEFSDAPDENSASAYMETQFFSAGSPYNVEPCKVIIYPSGWDGEVPVGHGVSSRLHVLLSHEAVHCYQNTVMSFQEQGGNNTNTIPQWISEGSATYVATLYTRYPEPATPSFWINYGWLGIPNKELIARSYDAVGWYSMVARATGNDLTGKFVAAWRAFVDGGYNDDAYVAALGGDVPAVEAAWAPSLLHAPQWGDAWDTPGIGVPADAQPTAVKDTIAAQDTPFSVQVAPYGAVVDSESAVTDGLVEVSIDNGLASVHDLGSADALDFTDQVFCIEKACDNTEVTCQNSPKHITPIPLTVPFFVAAGGSSTMGTLTMENISVPTTPDTPVDLPKDAGPCGAAGPLPPRPAGFSDGDPHIQALNGGSYDFQGAGEYTLVRSASGDVDVQVRSAPAPESKTAAWNTAVAMRVVSTQVEVDVGEPLVVLVDGKRITLPTQKGRSLAGGGRLSYISNGVSGDIVVTWPDGSQLDVFADRFAENATFTPPAAGVDSFSGLLSAFVLPRGIKKTATTSFETLLGGDGHSYVVNPLTSAGFKLLYGPFADSWRVTTKASLFTYRKGKSTSSFDVKGFPARFETFAEFPASKRKSAAATCKAAGVTNPKLLADCELDVGETGHAELEAAAARLQSGGTSKPAAPSSGGSGSDHQPPGSGAVHPVSYYFSHPCDVLTNAEIALAIGYPAPEYVSVGSGCPIGTAIGDDIEFSHQSVEKFKSLNPGSAGSGPVPSLGHDAYCINKPVAALIQAFVVVSLGPAGSLRILAEDCATATALTKDALARISGL
jgi:hypothetical protein